MDKKMAYLVTFFTNISFCANAVIDIQDEDFQKCIFGFIESFYMQNKNIMNKVFEIKTDGNQVQVKVDFDGALKYGSLYRNNPVAFSKMYDMIGDKDIDKIMKLAELFCYYVNEFNDLVAYKRIRN